MLLACTLSASEPTPAPEPVLGPEVGESVVSPEVAAGTYRLALSYSWRGYITMERVVSDSERGQLDLTLSPQGVMTGTAQLKTHRSHDVSEYESHDGQHHHEASESEQLWRFEGVWRQDPEHAVLEVQKLSYVAEGELHPVDDPVTLRCRTVTAKTLPVRTLACQPSGREPDALRRAFTVPAGPPLPEGQVMPGIQARDEGNAWLLLGAAPGLSVSWSERDNRRELVSFEAL